jgi:hypothetical protein
LEDFVKITDQRKSFFVENYNKVKNAYDNPYDMPELDPLRHEIALCIMFGLHQAAITLTNHLIEWFIKLILIYNHSIQNEKPLDKSKSMVDNLEEHFSDGIKNYTNKDMSETIRAAKSAGLLTKEQWKELDKIREDFRNAFGHADSSKIFKTTEIGLTGVSIDDNQFKTDEKKSVKISNIPIIQGLLKIEFAKKNAIPYFLYIDELIRITLPRLFPELGSNI